MGEFASKGVAGSGLGLGIAGTALGVLSASNNGGGLLGGLFGNGIQPYAQGAAQAAMAEKDATIARLRAEKYTDQAGIEVYKAHRSEMNDTADRILGNWIKPLAVESAANRERLASLEAKVDGNHQMCQKDLELMRKDIEISRLTTQNGIEKMDAKVDMVAVTARNGIATNSAAIASLQATVDGITCQKVCRDAICPEVMPRYNSWVAPTDMAPATQPISGTVNVAK